MPNIYPTMPVTITQDNFGHTISNDGIEKIVRRITLQNNCLKLQVINYGATITSLQVLSSDKNDDIVLGYDTISSYEDDTYYFGCTVGRFANRISKGKFHLQSKEHSLNINNGPNHLHGGLKGFNKVLWDYAIDSNRVIFSYTSPALEEKYPGELRCSVAFELTDSNDVIIHYYATATEKTPINLTNHSYFNLGGHTCNQCNKAFNHKADLTQHKKIHSEERSVCLQSTSERIYL